jgi:undecaprenyl-diphosphatase
VHFQANPHSLGVLLGLAAVLGTAISLVFVPSHAASSRTAAEPAEGATSLDVRIFRFLNAAIADPALDAVMPFVTDFQRWRIYAVAAWIGLIIFGGSKGRWAALMLIPLVAASDRLTSGVLKPLTMRLRPTEVLAHVHFWSRGSQWIWTPSDSIGGFKSSFAFPSSHAANFTASMLFLSLVYKRWVPYVCLPFAGLVCLSRIYTGVHWPTDVLAGIMIGGALAWLAYIAFRRLPLSR